MASNHTEDYSTLVNNILWQNSQCKLYFSVSSQGCYYLVHACPIVDIRQVPLLSPVIWNGLVYTIWQWWHYSCKLPRKGLSIKAIAKPADFDPSPPTGKGTHLSTTVPLHIGQPTNLGPRVTNSRPYNISLECYRGVLWTCLTCNNVDRRAQ